MHKLIPVLLLLTCLTTLSGCIGTHPPSVLPPPRNVPFQNASWIIVNSPDSAAVAYKKLLQGLTDMSYEMRATNSKDRFLLTKSKKVNHIAGLALQVTVEPRNRGSEVTIAGKLVAIDSTGKEEVDSRKWVWMRNRADNALEKQLWNEVHQIAVQLFPKARIGYY